MTSQVIEKSRLSGVKIMKLPGLSLESITSMRLQCKKNVI
jgi:hypothetical protein